MTEVENQRVPEWLRPEVKGLIPGKTDFDLAILSRRRGRGFWEPRFRYSVDR